MSDTFPKGMLDNWKKLLFSPEGLEVDPTSGLLESVFRDPILFPLQRKREMRKMLDLAEEVHPEVVYEIGSDKGGSLLHWCMLPTVKRVIACEVRGTPYKELFEERFPHLDFLWLNGSSYDVRTVSVVRNWLHADRIDVLFIDGDKGAFHQDFYVYQPLMENGGVVFFHDVNGESAMRTAFKVCSRGKRSYEILDVSEGEEAAERERKGVPMDSGYEEWLRIWKTTSCGVGVVHV